MSKQKHTKIQHITEYTAQQNKDRNMIEIKETQKYFTGMKFIDLFAGIGGFRLALESLGGECVYSIDIDKHAAKTYEKNFGDNPLGDITEISPKEIPDHDILCAGFPCVAFSIAGKQRGFADTRGTLFFDVARIIKTKKPKIVFMENVKNFAKHDGGRTISVVEGTMHELGYSFHYKMMPAAQYGAATNRERVYMVCFRNDISEVDKLFTYPEKEQSHKIIRDMLLEPTDGEVMKRYRDNIPVTWSKNKAELENKISNRPVRLGVVRSGRQGERIYSANSVAPTFAAQGGGVFSKTGGYLIDGHIRTLAPREAARIMGFPDTYKLDDSDTQALKQIGNSVVVDVIQRVALTIGEAYHASETKKASE